MHFKVKLILFLMLTLISYQKVLFTKQQLSNSQSKEKLKIPTIFFLNLRYVYASLLYYLKDRQFYKSSRLNPGFLILYFFYVNKLDKKV
jgi:hypothetical protein